MKKTLCVLLAAALALCAAGFAGAETIPVKKLAFVDKVVLLAPDTYVHLNVTVEPSSAAGTELIWKSSSEAVATVDENGVLTAHKKGSATITVTAPNSKAKATITVKVQEYDLVFRSPEPQAILVTYKKGNNTRSGSVKRGNVKLTNPEDYARVEEETEWPVEVVPLSVGDDEITIKLNGGRRKYTVYVSEAAFEVPAEAAEEAPAE